MPGSSAGAQHTQGWAAAGLGVQCRWRWRLPVLAPSSNAPLPRHRPRCRATLRATSITPARPTATHASCATSTRVRGGRGWGRGQGGWPPARPARPARPRCLPRSPAHAPGPTRASSAAAPPRRPALHRHLCGAAHRGGGGAGLSLYGAPANRGDSKCLPCSTGAGPAPASGAPQRCGPTLPAHAAARAAACCPGGFGPRVLHPAAVLIQQGTARLTNSPCCPMQIEEEPDGEPLPCHCGAPHCTGRMN